MNRRRRTAIAAALAGSAIVAATAAQAAPGDTELASRIGADGPAGAGASTDAAISANGCRVAFASTAPDLDPVDVGPGSDVFVRDLCAAQTFEVSVTDAGADGNGASTDPDISADGSTVVFSSTATNLGGETSSDSDVYRRDLDSDDTALVSESSSGSQPSVSANGQLVAFSGPSTGGDVLVRDMSGSGLTNASPDASAAREPSISDDGALVAFSGALDGDADGFRDVLVRDLGLAATELASRADGAGGAQGNGDSADPELSGDGSVVAFESAASNLGGPAGQVFVRDLAADATELVSRRSGASGAPAGSVALDPSLSGDGDVVAFASADSALVAGTPSGTNVFARHRAASTTSRVSAGATAGTQSLRPSVSGAGAYVAFDSTAALSSADANSAADVYRHELVIPGQPPGVTTQPPAELPIQAVRVNLLPVRGTVLVRFPGSKKFVRITDASLIPIGSIVDVSDGEADLLAERAGIFESATFFNGIFKILQSTGANAPLEARLTGKLGCGEKKSKSARASDALARTAAASGRGLWGRGSGRFRTRGRRGAGTVRGTTWFVADRCDGSTVFRVKEGTIEVNDFGKRGGVDKVIEAPGSYRAGSGD